MEQINGLQGTNTIESLQRARPEAQPQQNIELATPAVRTRTDSANISATARNYNRIQPFPTVPPRVDNPIQKAVLLSAEDQQQVDLVSNRLTLNNLETYQQAAGNASGDDSETGALGRAVLLTAEDQQQVDLVQGQLAQDQLETYQDNYQAATGAEVENGTNEPGTLGTAVLLTAEDQQQVDLVQGQLAQDQIENYQDSYQGVTGTAEEANDVAYRDIPLPERAALLRAEERPEPELVAGRLNQEQFDQFQENVQAEEDTVSDDTTSPFGEFIPSF